MPSSEEQVIAFLLSVDNLAFLLFDEEALLLSGTVGNLGPPCSLGKDAFWHQQNSNAWNLKFTYVCGSRLLALIASCGYLWGRKDSGLEGAYKTAEAIESTCIRAWAFKCLFSCCRCGGPKSEGSQTPEACLRVLGHGNCCRHRRKKPLGNQNSGAFFTGMGSRRVMQ